MLRTFLYCCLLHRLVAVCRPFVPDLYEDEGEDDDVLDEEGRTRLKLKVQFVCSVVL